MFVRVASETLRTLPHRHSRDCMQVGIQGFLKLSITVLGPGDPMPVHDLEEDMKAERLREQEDPRAEGTMQFARDRKLEYIALGINRASELLTTSNLILTSKVCHAGHNGLLLLASLFPMTDRPRCTFASSSQATKSIAAATLQAMQCTMSSYGFPPMCRLWLRA